MTKRGEESTSKRAVGGCTGLALKAATGFAHAQVWRSKRIKPADVVKKSDAKVD